MHADLFFGVSEPVPAAVAGPPLPSRGLELLSPRVLMSTYLWALRTAAVEWHQQPASTFRFCKENRKHKRNQTSTTIIQYAKTPSALLLLMMVYCSRGAPCAVDFVRHEMSDPFVNYTRGDLVMVSGPPYVHGVRSIVTARGVWCVDTDGDLSAARNKHQAAQNPIETASDCTCVPVQLAYSKKTKYMKGRLGISEICVI